MIGTRVTQHCFVYEEKLKTRYNEVKSVKCELSAASVTVLNITSSGPPSYPLLSVIHISIYINTFVKQFYFYTA